MAWLHHHGIGMHPTREEEQTWFFGCQTTVNREVTVSIGIRVGGPRFERGSGMYGCEMVWTRFKRREVGQGQRREVENKPDGERAGSDPCWCVFLTD